LSIFNSTKYFLQETKELCKYSASHEQIDALNLTGRLSFKPFNPLSIFDTRLFMPNNRRRTSAQMTASKNRQIGRSPFADNRFSIQRVRRIQSADDRRLARVIGEPREHSILTSAMILAGETFFQSVVSPDVLESLTRQGLPIEQDDYGNGLYK
jgi:hypothetical protein